MAPTEYRYDPQTGAFTDLKLGTSGDIKPDDFVVSDLEAKAHDGTMVPLSLIEPKGAKKPEIVLIEAYGSYGISELADFSSRRAAAANLAKPGGWAARTPTSTTPGRI